MTDLSDERLARLRVWATRRKPDRPDHPRHSFYAFCPWCASAGDPDDGFDGNAHDLAVELIDEVVRLRVEVSRLHRIPWRHVVAMARKVVFYYRRGDDALARSYVAACQDALDVYDGEAGVPKAPAGTSNHDG